MIPLIREKVRLLILIGEARQKMDAVLGSEARTFKFDNIEDAVALARKEARPGEVVLLSPACASFDLFDDYAHRGRVFTRLVKQEAA